MWNKRYLLGGNVGWEDNNTGDSIYSVHRHGWEVILNTHTIKTCETSSEADDYIESYIFERCIDD